MTVLPHDARQVNRRCARCEGGVDRGGAQAAKRGAFDISGIALCRTAATVAAAATAGRSILATREPCPCARRL